MAISMAELLLLLLIPLMVSARIRTNILTQSLSESSPSPFPPNFLFGTSSSSYQAQTSQTSEITLLSCSEAIERLRASRESYRSKQEYVAMYSSIFGGIVTDTAAMLIPIDDHIVHRGHGVFDTAAIVDGYLYELDQHIERFMGSAAMAKIKLPFSKESITRILIQTVSASKCKTGSLRYWLSTGPGDFQLSPSSCHQSALYAIVIQDQSPPDYHGVKVITSSVPIKPPQFAVMKSVNYLPNALSKMEAEENGAYAAIWLDDDGFVAEGPNMNVAFVTNEKELLMPNFHKILTGCTAKRVLLLAEDLVKQGELRSIRVENVCVGEGKRAAEMMLIGSGVVVRPVVQWDDQLIGHGKEGPVTRVLRSLILEDMKSGPDTTGLVYLVVYPPGMEKVVTYVKERFPNIPLYITENGYCDTTTSNSSIEEVLYDTKRVKFLSDYLDALGTAIRKGADVRGYFIWSLFDNFEWTYGYTKRLGFYHFDRVTLKRTPKLSAKWYKQFIAKNQRVGSKMQTRRNPILHLNQ